MSSSRGPTKPYLSWRNRGEEVGDEVIEPTAQSIGAELMAFARLEYEVDILVRFD